VRTDWQCTLCSGSVQKAASEKRLLQILSESLRVMKSMRNDAKIPLPKLAKCTGKDPTLFQEWFSRLTAHLNAQGKRVRQALHGKGPFKGCTFTVATVQDDVDDTANLLAELGPPNGPSNARTQLNSRLGAGDPRTQTRSCQGVEHPSETGDQLKPMLGASGKPLMKTCLPWKGNTTSRRHLLKLFQ